MMMMMMMVMMMMMMMNSFCQMVGLLGPGCRISTIVAKIFVTGSSFHVKQGSNAKAQFLFFSSFLVVLTNIHFGSKAGH